MWLTLTEVEEAGGEDGRAEETEEDGATDEAETDIFLLGAKPLSDGTEGVLQLTTRTQQGERERRRACVCVCVSTRCQDMDCTAVPQKQEVPY